MVLADSVVWEYVERYNAHDDADKAYSASVQGARDLVRRNAWEEDVERIVKPFLYKWGRMGRVLGKSEFKGWEAKLAKTVSSNAPLLRRYTTAELAEADLRLEKLHIEELYGSFRAVVGPVAATKVLHLFCPGFFPMWDTAIAQAARKERLDKGRGAVAARDFSAEDYYQFFEQVQSFIISHSILLSQLVAEYKKTKVKIVDEVFWWATQRPLCLIL